MIQRNQLKTPVLITSDEVIFHAPTDKDVDPRHIWQNIIVAERRFVKPALGADLYARLVYLKNRVVTADNKVALQALVDQQQALTPTGQKQREQITLAVGDLVNSDSFLIDAKDLALWRDHLHKITAEAVFFTAIPTNRARFTSQGVVKNFPDTVGNAGAQASLDLDDTRHLMTKALQDRIQPLLDDMHLYLCLGGFTNYIRACDCPGAAGTQLARKTGILLAYEEDLEDDCKPCGRRGYGYPEGFFQGPAYLAPSLPAPGSPSTGNEVVYFSNVSTFVLPWDATRIGRFGSSGIFQVEIISDDGQLRPSGVEIIPNDPINPSFYTFDMGGVNSGRIIIA